MDFLSPVNTASSPLAQPFSALAPMLGSPNLGGAVNRVAIPAPVGGVQDPAVATLLAQQELTTSLLTSLLTLLTQLLASAPNNSQTSGANAGGASATPVSGAGGAAPVGGGSGVAPVSGNGAGGGGVSSIPSSSTPGTAGQKGFINPIDGNLTVSSDFGPRSSPTSGAPDNHTGIDIPKPAGTPIRAAKAGTVSVSRSDSGGYGNWVEIKHEDGSSTRYAHMSKRGVEQGSRVEQGQTIGTVGSTGNSTGNHLHFEYRNPQGQAVNPKDILKL